VVESAFGGEHWTIELPNPFGVEVGNNLAFTARETLPGEVTGSWTYQQTAEGETFRFVGRISCLNVYDGNRAKLGGVVTYSNDPTVVVGSFGLFQVFDNGQGETDPPAPDCRTHPDQTTTNETERSRTQYGAITPLTSGKCV
jgi:hypothetical protein